MVRPKKARSPAVYVAKRLKTKYSKGFPKTPTKSVRAKKALFEVNSGASSIHAAADKHELSYSFLQRRICGVVGLHSRNGPSPFLTIEEEDTITEYISEMALRGMGLSPSNIMDLVQDLLKKEKRKNPFKDSRPGYSWYYNFMGRHSNKLEKRKETLLEASRSKVTPQQMDTWFDKYQKFLSDRDMLNKPHRLWNADETGFTMGSKPGIVIGPSRSTHPDDIPHVSGGSTKKRLTVMYCGNAAGKLMPPYFVYPQPKPSGYDPMIGASQGSAVSYTKKGWMNNAVFSEFIDHFDKYAGEDRPVVLLMDSVSSHISMDVFTKASNKQIELYRLVPNATHLLQPLDKGVFGPLKKQWYATVKNYTRLNPGQSIGKQNFASLLAEAHDKFYKPSIVVGSFRGSGIYPVNRQAVSNDRLKPSATFSLEHEEHDADETNRDDSSKVENAECGAEDAFNCLQSILDTPIRKKYEERLEEGYNVEGASPGFIVYKKLKEKIVMGKKDQEPRSISNIENSVHRELPTSSNCGQFTDAVQSCTPRQERSGLSLLAEAALGPPSDSPMDTHGADRHPDKSSVSPILLELVKFPQVKSQNEKPRRILDSLPDCLSSNEAIRQMALSKLKTAKVKAAKEITAKAKYLAKRAKQQELEKKRCAKKSLKEPKIKKKKIDDESSETICPVCFGSFNQETASAINMVWVQCDRCMAWMHKDCIPLNYVYREDAFSQHSDIEFVCHVCVS